MSKGSRFRRLSPRLRESLEKATTLYAQNVDACATYLTSRGLTEETIATARLGFVAEPEPGHEGMVGRLAIPYRTPSGVVALRFRCLRQHNCKDEGCPKYLSETGVEPHLYGVYALRREGDTIAICEGEVDCLTANQAGIPAVGVPGVHAWCDDWGYLFEGYSRIVVFMDDDRLKNGKSAGRALAAKICKVVYDARVVSMGEGEDVNSFYCRFGADALRRRAGIDD